VVGRHRAFYRRHDPERRVAQWRRQGARRRNSRSEFFVDLAAVRDLDDQHEDLVIVNDCKNPIVAHPISPELLVDQLLAELTRILQLRELLLEENSDPVGYDRIELADLFRCLRGKSNGVKRNNLRSRPNTGSTLQSHKKS
jgi:hypothetical protein